MEKIAFPGLTALDRRRSRLDYILGRKSKKFEESFTGLSERYGRIGAILDTHPEKTEERHIYSSMLNEFDEIDPTLSFNVEHSKSMSRVFAPYKGAGTYTPFLLRYRKNPYNVLASTAETLSSRLDNIDYVNELDGGELSLEDAKERLKNAFSSALERCNDNTLDIFYSVGGDIVKNFMTLNEKYIPNEITVEKKEILDRLSAKISDTWARFCEVCDDFENSVINSRSVEELALPSRLMIDALSELNQRNWGLHMKLKSYDMHYPRPQLEFRNNAERYRDDF